MNRTKTENHNSIGIISDYLHMQWQMLIQLQNHFVKLKNTFCFSVFVFLLTPSSFFSKMKNIDKGNNIIIISKEFQENHKNQNLQGGGFAAQVKIRQMETFCRNDFKKMFVFFQGPFISLSFSPSHTILYIMDLHEERSITITSRIRNQPAKFNFWLRLFTLFSLESHEFISSPCPATGKIVEQMR